MLLLIETPLIIGSILITNIFNANLIDVEPTTFTKTDVYFSDIQLNENHKSIYIDGFEKKAIVYEKYSTIFEIYSLDNPTETMREIVDLHDREIIDMVYSKNLVYFSFLEEVEITPGNYLLEYIVCTINLKTKSIDEVARTDVPMYMVGAEDSLYFYPDQSYLPQKTLYELVDDTIEQIEEFTFYIYDLEQVGEYFVASIESFVENSSFYTVILLDKNFNPLYTYFEETLDEYYELQQYEDGYFIKSDNMYYFFNEDEYIYIDYEVIGSTVKYTHGDYYLTVEGIVLNENLLDGVITYENDTTNTPVFMFINSHGDYIGIGENELYKLTINTGAETNKVLVTCDTRIVNYYVSVVLIGGLITITTKKGEVK